MSFYPTIRDDMIVVMNVVIKNLETDPSYLDNSDCPYSENVKNFFRRVGVRSGLSPDGVEALSLNDTMDDFVAIDRQIVQIINDLERFGQTLGSGDHTEKMAYFRTKSTLIERLVAMRERSNSLKEIMEFRTIILQFMDEVCSKDQISELMKRLDGVLGTVKDV